MILQGVLCRNDLAVARLNSWKRATKQACVPTQHHDLQRGPNFWPCFNASIPPKFLQCFQCNRPQTFQVSDCFTALILMPRSYVLQRFQSKLPLTSQDCTFFQYTHSHPQVFSQTFYDISVHSSRNSRGLAMLGAFILKYLQIMRCF